MTSRVRHLAYRCYRCGRPITCLEIVAAWEKAEKHPESPSMNLCACGSRHITPTNFTLLEELTTPRIWKLWFHRVLIPWLKAKF
jgi:hypothetical protein